MDVYIEVDYVNDDLDDGGLYDSSTWSSNGEVGIITLKKYGGADILYSTPPPINGVGMPRLGVKAIYGVGEHYAGSREDNS